MRARLVSRVVSFLLVLSLLAVPRVLHSGDDTVAFNVKTLKYHCLTCTWAKRCTRNCVEVSRAVAIEKGGVACKICGGSCPRPGNTSAPPQGTKDER